MGGMENTPQNPPDTAASPAPIDVPHLLNELLERTHHTVLTNQPTTGILTPEYVQPNVEAHPGEILRAALDKSPAGAVTAAADLAATRTENAEQLSQDRYTNSPAVTTTLVLFQRREYNRNTYDMECGSRQATTPAESLVRQDHDEGRTGPMS
jgi:hypothetical protein